MILMLVYCHFTQSPYRLSEALFMSAPNSVFANTCANRGTCGIFASVSHSQRLPTHPVRHTVLQHWSKHVVLCLVLPQLVAVPCPHMTRASHLSHVAPCPVLPAVCRNMHVESYFQPTAPFCGWLKLHTMPRVAAGDFNESVLCSFILVSADAGHQQGKKSRQVLLGRLHVE